MEARVHIIVSGRVQGVFFRARTKEVAQSLGLNGWVRNLEDGDVEIVGEGEKEKLEELVAWCRRGPPSAHVISLDARWETPAGGEETFHIRY